MPAPRGEILDASGSVVLATTRVGAEAAITADDLPPAGTRARWRLYVRLGAVLGMEPKRHLARSSRVSRWPGYEPAPIKDDICRTRRGHYLRSTRAVPRRVACREVNLREYPHGRIGGVVLGQIGPITAERRSAAAAYKGIAPGNYVGQAGLEAEYNSILQGRPGVEKVQVDAAGYPTGKAPRRDAADRRRRAPDLDHLRARARGLHRARPRRSSTRPRTTTPRRRARSSRWTRTRAACSRSARCRRYDPSMFVTPPSYAQLRAACRASYAFDDLATDGLFPTGSTFKPITALAGLRVRADHRPDAPGRRLLRADQHRDRSATPGTTTTATSTSSRALQESVDTYFYRLGAELNCATCDDAAIQHEARALGLGEHPGIDLPGGGSAGHRARHGYDDGGLNTQIIAAQFCHGSRPKPRATRATDARDPRLRQGYFDLWTIGQNVGLATGQGYLEASPMQMAVAYSAIVNGGTVWKPQIAEAIRSRLGRARAAAAGAGGHAARADRPLPPPARDGRACTRRRRAPPGPPTRSSATSRRRSTARPARPSTTARPTSPGTSATCPTARGRS